MNHSNPYAPSNEEAAKQPESKVTTVVKLTLFCGLAIFVCGFSGLFLGAFGGYCFRRIFPVVGPYEAYAEQCLNEAIGFGSTVGVIAGMLIGVVVTGWVSIREFRRRRAE